MMVTSTFKSATFALRVAAGASGLPMRFVDTTGAPAGNLTTLTVNGNAVAYIRQTIKGVEYALFQMAP